ncbi:TonB family protein [Erwinia tracheiphila]|uniref:TonB family protein n=1 Tax=Erwinia tracheiphila TaxID=65700 RepID=A0A345CRH5_9GAMM|nr:TonB family protein [Erwinia tracheiphila]AXF76042.1 TonB family protein [Erwinia tracheiphila]UIA85296.1 TonB family protein [Erwinia tracheiphila]
MKKIKTLVLLGALVCSAPGLAYAGKGAPEQNYVHVICDIDANGRVSNVRVTDRYLTYKASDAVKKQVRSIRFEPGDPKKDIAIRVKTGG